MGEKYKIYTKTGDDGTSGLVSGTRLKKYDQRLEAYGTIDELNAAIGLLRACSLPDNLTAMLVEVQNKLFNIGSRLATDEKGDTITRKLSITENHILFLEKSIDDMEAELPELKHFILPGGDIATAQCHVARTICRRAERRIIEFSERERVEPEIKKYINRLSDFLFVMARKLSSLKGLDEIPWSQL